MNRENLVVKHNKLIEAKSNIEFTKLEQKLFLAVVSEISSTEDKDLRVYPIKIKEFLELTGQEKIGGSQRKLIHDTAERLMDKIVRIKKDNGNTLSVAFLASAETTNDREYVEIEVSEKLKPYLINLGEMFTKYQLKNILQLESGHSVRIYELLKQYLKARSRKFEVTELKEFLGISDKYKGRFDNFENNVLKKAKKEINKYTDIDIDYEKIKRGRRITHIKFFIQPSVVDKESEVLERLYDENNYKELREKLNLIDKKLNRKQVFKLYEVACNKTDHIDEVNIYDYFKATLNYVEDKKPNSFYGYLKKALEEDYANAIAVLKLLGKED